MKASIFFSYVNNLLVKNTPIIVVSVFVVSIFTIDTVWAQVTDWVSDGVNIFYDSGNVGIRTTSPGQELDVVGDIRIDDTNNFGWWNKDAAGGSGPDYYAARISKTSSSYAGDMQFYTRYGGDNSEALVMELSSPQSNVGQVYVNGNIGLRTKTPQAALDVNGDVKVKTKTVTLHSLGRGCHSAGSYGFVHKVTWDPGGSGNEKTIIQVTSSFSSFGSEGTGSQPHVEIHNSPIKICVFNTGGKDFADTVNVYYIPLEGYE